jgi:hypothetical protein
MTSKAKVPFIRIKDSKSSILWIGTVDVVIRMPDPVEEKIW